MSLIFCCSSSFSVSDKLMETTILSCKNYCYSVLLDTSFVSEKILWNSGSILMLKPLFSIYFSSFSDFTFSTIDCNWSGINVFASKISNEDLTNVYYIFSVRQLIVFQVWHVLIYINVLSGFLEDLVDSKSLYLWNISHVDVL